MRSRRVRSRTADLFAAANAAPAPVSASVPAVTPASKASSTLSTPHARPRPRQLWYAVVFPTSPVLPDLCPYAQRFTSFVSIEAPNALLLEIQGSLRLLGPAQRLSDAIDACWRQLGVPAQSAVAPSTLGALWLARAGRAALIEDLALLAGALGRLPLATTGWDAARLRTLRSMGVTTVGEALRLPRAGLARRFGPEMVFDLDAALGRCSAPRRAFVRLERFRERCDLEAEIDSVVLLDHALAAMVGRCAAFLIRRQVGVQRLELRLQHRTAPLTRVTLGFAGVTADERRLREVLTQRLTRLELVAPVRRIELLSGRLQPLSAASLQLLTGSGAAQGRDTAALLVERLRARLGERAVYGVSAIAEHRPEAAWRRVQQLRLAAASAAGGVSLPVPRLPRPVWLLDAPRPLARPWDLEQGPERIESGWWDGKDVRRDYYVMRQSCGIRLWVFQERQSGDWYLHGVFS